MNFKKLICSVLLLAALCAAPLAASAAPVTAVRSSVSPARVRLVFDSREPVKYTAEKTACSWWLRCLMAQRWRKVLSLSRMR